MNKWIAEFELEDGDTMPEHMDMEYKGVKIDFHCRPKIQTGSTTDVPGNNVGKIDPTTKNDLALIHTEGLDEEIRCTMCTNSMKSDRGCDGSCVVNEDMYKAVTDAIGKRIQPTTTNDVPENNVGKIDSTTKNDSPKYCDRNICLKNEYNNIGCEDCEVTKSQESTTETEHWVNIKNCIDGKCDDCIHKCIDKPTEDCISRAEAIDTIRQLYLDLATQKAVIDLLKILPSVTPQPCEDAISRLDEHAKETVSHLIKCYEDGCFTKDERVTLAGIAFQARLRFQLNKYKEREDGTNEKTSD